MRRENNTFLLAAKATLRVTERDGRKDKALNNTVKGHNDLHRELTKVFTNK